jgi:RNA polymerase sigma-70 factor (ECF subfamily)
MPKNDAMLVREVLAGSQDAAYELVKRFERPVFALILRMVRDPGLSEDLAQEAFVKAFRALDSFHLDRKFSSWMFKIAHNTAIDHLRRSSPHEVPLETEGEGLDPLETLPAPEVEGPERQAERRDLREAFEACLSRLRPDYRQVMVLRFHQGLSYEEISEICELPMGTVKTHLHRARKQLSEDLGALGWGPESRPAGRNIESRDSVGRPRGDEG